jgi:hypothetical protein
MSLLVKILQFDMANLYHKLKTYKVKMKLKNL